MFGIPSHPILACQLANTKRFMKMLLTVRQSRCEECRIELAYSLKPRCNSVYVACLM
jgi:hypothetical protein